jgi:hypothetical protein
MCGAAVLLSRFWDLGSFAFANGILNAGRRFESALLTWFLGEIGVGLIAAGAANLRGVWLGYHVFVQISRVPFIRSERTGVHIPPPAKL